MAKKATLLDQQEKVVRALQDRLLETADNIDVEGVDALHLAIKGFNALKPRPKPPLWSHEMTGLKTKLPPTREA